MKEKWTTKNDVTTEVSLDTKFLEGGKITAEAVFNPNAGYCFRLLLCLLLFYLYVVC